MRWHIISLLLLVTLSLGAVAGEDVQLVVIKDFKFTPQEITVKLGDTVRWENQEKRQYHSVWFEASGEEETDYFFPEEFYERTFDSIGSFPYRCGPHPRMTGTIHVTE